MPWCDDCSKFWNPPEMGEGGACPTCHNVLAPAAGTTTLQKAKGAPWHFKLLLVGVTVYMVYRIYWFVEWLPKHI